MTGRAAIRPSSRSRARMSRARGLLSSMLDSLTMNAHRRVVPAGLSASADQWDCTLQNASRYRLAETPAAGLSLTVHAECGTFAVHASPPHPRARLRDRVCLAGARGRGGCTRASGGDVDDAAECAVLAALDFNEAVGARVTVSAALAPAADGLPARCRVTGTIAPRSRGRGLAAGRRLERQAAGDRLLRPVREHPRGPDGGRRRARLRHGHHGRRPQRRRNTRTAAGPGTTPISRTTSGIARCTSPRCSPRR